MRGSMLWRWPRDTRCVILMLPPIFIPYRTSLYASPLYSVAEVEVAQKKESVLVYGNRIKEIDSSPKLLWALDLCSAYVGAWGQEKHYIFLFLFLLLSFLFFSSFFLVQYIEESPYLWAWADGDKNIFKLTWLDNKPPCDLSFSNLNICQDKGLVTSLHYKL